MAMTAAEQKREMRKLEQKYRRLRRQAKRNAQKKKLPYHLLSAAVLLGIAMAALLFSYAQHRRDVPQNALLEVIVLDVGQGDAILLRTATHAVLIDAGDTDKGTAVTQALHEYGITRLDAVINSHPHADHIGGMQTVLEQLPTDALYFPDLPQSLLPTTASYYGVLETAAEQEIPIITPKCHDTLSLGDAELEFLCVDNSVFEDLNNCSLGCLLTCGTQRFFFAGDLESAGEAAFLEAGLIPPVTVLKASHHGSSTSATEAFLAAAQPQIVLISCGAENDYGHPSKQCLTRLNDAGCTVYRTDLDGTLCMLTDGACVWLES